MITNRDLVKFGQDVDNGAVDPRRILLSRIVVLREYLLERGKVLAELERELELLNEKFGDRSQLHLPLYWGVRTR